MKTANKSVKQSEHSKVPEKLVLKLIRALTVSSRARKVTGFIR